MVDVVNGLGLTWPDSVGALKPNLPAGLVIYTPNRSTTSYSLAYSELRFYSYLLLVAILSPVINHDCCWKLAAILLFVTQGELRVVCMS